MEPLQAIAELLQPVGAVPLRAADAAPSRPGAYLLVIDLDKALACRIGRRAVEIGKGCYIYAGSACGPGGIRARLARHFRRDKKPHWHVDRLTVAATGIQAFACEGGSECALVARLVASGLFEPAEAGFGSSDCTVCEAHLLRWRGAPSPAGLCSA